MNLRDILNPKTCVECRFIKVVNRYGGMGCGLECWNYQDHIGIYDNFDYNIMIHKDCPLPRIKCENCKHHSLWPDGASYCNKFAYDCVVACIEFEEVK